MPPGLDPHIDWRNLGLTLIAMLPALVLFGQHHDSAYLSEALVTVYLMVVVNRIALSPGLLLAHAALVGASITAFIVAERHAPVFILLCAGYAALAAGVGQWGENWKTLATFTFLPALYLGCELSSAPVEEHWHFARLYPVAVLPPCVLLVVLKLLRISQPSQPWWRYFSVAARPEQGRHKDRDAAVIRLFSVMIAATWVVVAHIEPQKWVIWSSASVVTGERDASLAKNKDRLCGVLVGVPLGIVLSLLLPHGPLLYSLSILLVGLSIDAIKNYRMAFGLRGALCVLAASSAAQGITLGITRVENVILGGLIGVAVSLLWHRWARRLRTPPRP